MFSWNFQAKTLTKALPLTVWKLWSLVPNWPNWDESLEWAQIDSFQVGSLGKIKAKGWPVSTFEISEMRSPVFFTTVAKLPLTKMEFLHTVEMVGENTAEITHSITVHGLLAPLLWVSMRPKVKKQLLKTVKALAELAEKT